MENGQFLWRHFPRIEKRESFFLCVYLNRFADIAHSCVSCKCLFLSFFLCSSSSIRPWTRHLKSLFLSHCLLLLSSSIQKQIWWSPKNPFPLRSQQRPQLILPYAKYILVFEMAALRFSPVDALLGPPCICIHSIKATLSLSPFIEAK